MQQSRILKLIDSMPFRLRMAGATISGRILSSLGAFAGILFAAIVTYAVNDEIGSSYMLIAPIGASAVLAFAVPSSPLAQPWSVLGGNCISVRQVPALRMRNANLELASRQSSQSGTPGS